MLNGAITSHPSVVEKACETMLRAPIKFPHKSKIVLFLERSNLEGKIHTGGSALPRMLINTPIVN